MRAGAVLALVATVALVDAADARRHHPRRPPAIALTRAVAVSEREWDVHASRPRVAAGTVVIAITNTGEDDHDLTVDGAAGTLASVLVHPGESTLLTLALAAGAYTLSCSLPGHAALGMTTTLRVS